MLKFVNFSLVYLFKNVYNETLQFLSINQPNVNF